jgi:non-specific serine/threonine protein kinase/serine/threonine-protein kinase
MDAGQWAQAKDILYQALELPAAGREAFLEQACAGQPDLLAEVRSLLDANAANSLIQTLGWKVESAETLPAGARIGPYVVVEELGRGGMGAVYLALRDDGQYQQQVAIKLVKRGMDSEALLRRFHYERQILAFLNHPFIARMLDGGAMPDGRPYFVMEYVVGRPIVDYVREKRLDRARRLQLFIQVCEAVAHAHQNLVVHRDLKPANILVTGDGTPRLLDFGVATLMLPKVQAPVDAARTVSHRLLTPSYASPEQFRGEMVTTASDVYSLGLVLYELLTGERAHQLANATYDEIYRAICEREPIRPSDAARAGKAMALKPSQLRGDLDRIVLKALQKEPARRYASVEQFAGDIRLFLDGHPVRAQDDSWSYRASKFVTRHRASVAASGLALLSLLAGAATTAWQARVARTERDRAERRFEDVRRLATAFLVDNDTIAAVPGGTALRRNLITRSLEYLDRLAQDSVDNRSLRSELALAYEKMGDVQGRQDGPNVGDTAGALASYRKARALRQAILRDYPDDPQAQLDLAQASARLSGALKVAGSFEEALLLDRESLEIRERLHLANPDNPETKRLLAASLTNLGGTLSQVGDWSAVIDARRRALALYEDLARDVGTAEDWRGVTLAHSRLASIYRHEKLFAEAGRHYRASLANSTAALQRFPGQTNLLILHAASWTGLGLYLRDVNRLPEAVTHFRKALDEYAAIAGADPQDVRAMSLLGSGHHDLGKALLLLARYPEASRHLGAALRVRENVAKLNPVNAGARGEVAETWAALGELWQRLNRPTQAREAYQQAANLLSRLERERKLNVASRAQLLQVQARLAQLAPARNLPK